MQLLAIIFLKWQILFVGDAGLGRKGFLFACLDPKRCFINCELNHMLPGLACSIFFSVINLRFALSPYICTSVHVPDFTRPSLGRPVRTSRTGGCTRWYRRTGVRAAPTCAAVRRTSTGTGRPKSAGEPQTRRLARERTEGRWAWSDGSVRVSFHSCLLASDVGVSSVGFTRAGPYELLHRP